MSMKVLAVHLAEIAGWPGFILNTPGLDFAATPYKPAEVASTAELLALFDKMVPAGRAALASATEAQMNDPWVMSMGEHIISKDSKYENFRHAFGQMIHHRAQLGMYLRLLDVAVPESYGPTADSGQ